MRKILGSASIVIMLGTSPGSTAEASPREYQRVLAQLAALKLPQDPAQAKAVVNLLRATYALMSQHKVARRRPPSAGPPVPRGHKRGRRLKAQSECMPFAYKVAYSSLSKAKAVELAGKTCRGVLNMELFKIAFAQAYKTHTKIQALSIAKEVTRGLRPGAESCFDFAFKKAYSSTTRTKALRIAGKTCRL